MPQETLKTCLKVEQLAWEWKENYNFHRLHQALGFKTPMEVKEEYWATL